VFVEIDETYIGGKPRKENKKLDENGNVIPSDKPKNNRGRGTKKMPVVGVKERNSKQIYAQVMLPNEEGKKLSGKQLLAVLDETCKEGTIVISDDFKGYKILDKKLEFGETGVYRDASSLQREIYAELYRRDELQAEQPEKSGCF
jgi:hypothetical protein